MRSSAMRWNTFQKGHFTFRRLRRGGHLVEAGRDEELRAGADGELGLRVACGDRV